DEVLVPCQLQEPNWGQLTEQPDRVALDPPPQRGIEGGEQVLGRRGPRPAQIGRQTLQRGELVGKLGTDGESTQSSHEHVTLTKTPDAIESGTPRFHPTEGGVKLSLAVPARFDVRREWSDRRRRDQPGCRLRAVSGQGRRGRARPGSGDGLAG